jgi:SAM-dependent methyltransferase
LTDDAGLAARQAFYRWQDPPLDLPGVVVAALPTGAGVVVDVGCGNGVYLQRIHSERPQLAPLGVDISPAMLTRLRDLTGCRAVVAADAAALPLPDASAVAAMAVHVLYLLADPVAAVAELCRVVRPGGRVLVATSADEDKSEMWRLLADALSLPPVAVNWFNLHRRFTLDDAIRAVGNRTDRVEVRELRSEVRLDRVTPLLAYVDSLRWLSGSALTAHEWAGVMARLRDRAQATVRAAGALRVRTHIGVVVGRVPD